MHFCTRPSSRKPKGAALVASSCGFTGYGEAAGEGYAGASAESGGAAADYGGSAVEVSGEEEKKIHVVLDGIVSRLGVDIVDAEKKHKDAEIAFEKESKEAKEAKVALDADQQTFDMAKSALDLAKNAVDVAKTAHDKQAEEEEDAKKLANDDSWKEEVKDLKSSITAISTLREEVEKLNVQYVHRASTTAVPTPTPTTPTSTTLPPTTTTPTTTTTATVAFLGKEKSNTCGAGAKQIFDEQACKAAGSALGMKWRGSCSLSPRPTGCYVSSGRDTYFNTAKPGQPAASRAPVCVPSTR